MSSSSEDEEDTMNMLPEIVPVSSIASFSDSTVSSSGRASPSPANMSVSVSPPRSIFHNYWASPRCTSSDGGGSGEGSQAPAAVLEKADGGSKERELLHKLSSLSLPLVDDDDEDEQPSTDLCASNSLTRSSSSAQAAPSPKMVDAKAFRRPSIDDSTITYSRDKKNPSASTPRRKILPTVVAPPPQPAPPATNTHNVRDLQLQRVALREQTQRPWSSTTALIKRPTHSCLRPSRYSCSMIDERELAQRRDASEDAAAAVIAARAAMCRSKSVSFYSQVSVFEFVKYGKGAEDVRPSKDWSKYFVS